MEFLQPKSVQFIPTTENCTARLTNWGRVTHICVSKLTNISSGNGLSPGRRQIIIWTNDGILLIGPLETNFSEIIVCKMGAILSPSTCYGFTLNAEQNPYEWTIVPNKLMKLQQTLVSRREDLFNHL